MNGSNENWYAFCIAVIIMMFVLIVCLAQGASAHADQIAKCEEKGGTMVKVKGDGNYKCVELKVIQ